MEPLVTDAGPTHSLGSPGLVLRAGWLGVCPAVRPLCAHREGSLSPDSHPALTCSVTAGSVSQEQAPHWTSGFPLLRDSRGASGLLSGPLSPYCEDSASGTTNDSPS